jgi:hypothetical protein
MLISSQTGSTEYQYELMAKLLYQPPCLRGGFYLSGGAPSYEGMEPSSPSNAPIDHWPTACNRLDSLAFSAWQRMLL